LLFSMAITISSEDAPVEMPEMPKNLLREELVDEPESAEIIVTVDT